MNKKIIDPECSVVFIDSFKYVLKNCEANTTNTALMGALIPHFSLINFSLLRARIHVTIIIDFEKATIQINYKYYIDKPIIKTFANIFDNKNICHHIIDTLNNIYSFAIFRYVDIKMWATIIKDNQIFLYYQVGENNDTFF